MTGSMLNSLMKLFAIIASINKKTVSVLSRSFVDSYLSSQFSPGLVKEYLMLYDSNYSKFDRIVSEKAGKATSSLSVKIMSICMQINSELHISDRYQIMLSLIGFEKYFENRTGGEDDFTQSVNDAVQTIVREMMIDEKEFSNCSYFIRGNYYRIPDKSKLLIISEEEQGMLSELRQIHRTGLDGQLIFLKIKQVELYIFYYTGKDSLELNNRMIFPRQVYVFQKGSSIIMTRGKRVFYSDVDSAFAGNFENGALSFHARNISYSFPHSDNGIKKFSFSAGSGQLIGIMGGSGTGKTTLLKMLNGSLKPDEGNIYINGYDIHHKHRKTEGIMGYVPQDDLLIAELTVFQNLYYNAKLCLGGMDKEDIKNKVYEVLEELGLNEIKKLKVGSPLNKFISGGQRKRLNIALEIIRQPSILLIDEPTSGLSSTDSENVLQLLKTQTHWGKLVIINIHQPSSDLFRYFDRLLVMDKGGYPVYFGNPTDSLLYFKKKSMRVDREEAECRLCGNIRTDDILDLLEMKKVNEKGEYTNERKIKPEKWYQLFRNELEEHFDKEFPEKNELKTGISTRPGRLSQFITFSTRNLLSKFADRQYMLMAVCISPLLAIILGYFTKYSSGSQEDPLEYIFRNNENLPAYIFMCVIVALFIGMIVSAEEIIKDRVILERESLLKLSRSSYLNSKIFFLLGLSAFQMFIFVVLGHQILEIKGMTASYWLVLFTTSVFANLLGLSISSSLRSVIAIYIAIPFILVPFILLAGVIVDYDRLHHRFASSQYVPFTAELIPSRWAYEALITEQFSKNRYQRIFLNTEREIENNSYKLDQLIPEMINRLKDADRLISIGKQAEAIKLIGSVEKSMWILGLDRENLDGQATTDPGYINRLSMKLISLKPGLSKKIYKWRDNRDKLIDSLNMKGLPRGMLAKLKKEHHNKAVEELALNLNDLKKVIEEDGVLIQNSVPVYRLPSSTYGRSHFFSGTKVMGRKNTETIYFNMAVLWLMSGILYIFLWGSMNDSFGILSKFHIFKHKD